MLMLLLLSEEIAHLATKSFLTYIKSIALMADRQVFNLKRVLESADSYAASLGLFRTPAYDIGQQAKLSQWVEETVHGATETTTEGSGTEFIGGVEEDNSAKRKKNQTSLERLQEKMQSGASAEDDGRKLTRREKRQQKIRAMRERAKLTERKAEDPSSVLITVTSTKAEASVRDEEDVEDWRESAAVQRALRKQRLVVRSDGTLKLKGAAKSKLQ